MEALMETITKEMKMETSMVMKTKVTTTEI